MPKLMWSTVLAGALVCGTAAVAPAQLRSPLAYAPQAPSSSRDTPSTAQNLDVLVRADFDKQSLESVLRQIARSAKLELNYSARTVADKTVTLHLGSVTARAAIQAALAGTGLSLVVRKNGQMVIVPADSSGGRRAETGAIVGRVADVATKRGIPRVPVSVGGTRIVALSDANGMYHLDGIAAGTVQVTARLLGYGAVNRSVTIRGDDTVTVDFELSAIPSRLQEVVTTGAGYQAKYKMGNSIATINADSVVPTTPIRNMSDLLNGRVAGAAITSTSGAVGSGSQIRIRGVATITGSSDPIVIVDGVRMDAGYTSAVPGAQTGSIYFRKSAAANQQTGNPATSRLDDIDPETIETVEVLKGPSASTLYGSDAANGVIVVTTKRGKPGPTRWSFFGQSGWSKMKATFMDSYHGWGESATQASTLCGLYDLGNGSCSRQDSVTHYNPLNHAETSPFGTGTTTKYGAQVSGGSAQMQYFIGGDYNDDVGLQKLPSFDARRFLVLRSGTPLPDWVERPNVLQGLRLSSNLTSQVASTADVQLTSSFSHEYHRDDAGGDAISASTQSLGYRDTIGGGWGTQSPVNAYLSRSTDEVNHGNAGLSGNWRPASFLSARSTVGADYSDRSDESFTPTDILPGTTGLRGKTSFTTMVRTANLSGTLDLPFWTRYHSRATAGWQYTRTDQNGLTGNGNGLAGGTDVLNNAATTTVSEFHSASAVNGWFFEETMSMNDRLFVTGAVRGDASSSFGTATKTPLYPKFSASYLVSQEPFFPRLPGVSSLRLRTAFGHAGVQPPPDAQFRSFKSTAGYIAGSATPAVIVSTVGNPTLKPERSTEWEGGFDLSMFEDRLTFDVTSYRKMTRDALVDRPLPPSLGVGTRKENIGKVENRGLELSATARPIVSSLVSWTSVVNLSRNRNRLVTLGPLTFPIVDPVSGMRYAEGYPVNGFWARPILGYADTDGDGVIELGEVRLGDSSVYRGQAFPKADITLHNELAFFSGRMSVAAGVNYVRGQTQLNTALKEQCSNSHCAFTHSLETSLATQALVIAANPSLNGGSVWGYMEHGSLVRLSELSLTFSATPSVARRLRARTATVSVMGRNLGLWSNYRGPDPEVNSTVYGNQSQDNGGVPQPRDWSVRVNLGF